MAGFHTWHFKSGGVSWDSGCEHEGSHLMHDKEHFILCCINCMKCD